MSDEIPAVDQYGNRGTFRKAGGGGGCLGSPLLLIAALVIALLAGISFVGGKLSNSIQSNIPVHDSLRNIQVSCQDSRNYYSDSAGLHVVGPSCNYSSTDYGDVDVTVTTHLVTTGGVDPSSDGYGIELLSDSDHGSNFAITPDGKWYMDFSNNAAASPSETPSSVIHQGLGSTNTLEVRRHGSRFDFFVNGNTVGSTDEPELTGIYGSIRFFSGGIGDEVGEEVVFTDLTIGQ